MEEIKGKTGFWQGFTPLGSHVFVTHIGVMQSLRKNENLLFKNFQDFLVQRQHPEKYRDSSLSPMG